MFASASCLSFIQIESLHGGSALRYITGLRWQSKLALGKTRTIAGTMAVVPASVDPTGYSLVQHLDEDLAQ